MKTEAEKSLLPPTLPAVNQKNSIKTRIKDRLQLCALLLVILLFLSLLQIGCPLRALTGIPCPGCGMTRAVEAALSLHFDDAFRYHPLFLLTPVMLMLFLFDDFIRSGYVKIIWVAIIIVFIITYLDRLFFTGSSVVKIDLSSGLVLKLIHHFIV